MTPQPQQPSKEELEAFLAEYKALIDKHQVDFVHFPMWQPDPNGNWQMTVQSQVISTKALPTPSPFVAE